MNFAARSSLIGAGVGAGLMFLFDPSRGARRRALIRDKFVRVARRTREAAGATGRDLTLRTSGLAARTRSRFGPEVADDRVVCERVRSDLGRVASHPRAIHVASNGGIVTLTGDVLAGEVSTIVARVNHVRGVCEVRNRMMPHAAANGIPALQGHSERSGWWSTWMRSDWSPTAIAATGAGAAAMAVAIARR